MVDQQELDKHTINIEMLINIYANAINESEPNTAKFFEYTNISNNLVELRDFLRDLSNILNEQQQGIESCGEIESQDKPTLGLLPEDIEGLPEELLNELRITDSDKIEFKIIEVIREYGGKATLDQIIVGMYKKTNEIYKRLNLNSKLYRMMQKGMIHSVEGKKGVYEI